MKIFLLFISLFVSSLCFSDEYVQGYVNKNGTYVAPHYRTSPDSNPYNNYSHAGNVNPYTGQPGTNQNNNYHYNQNKDDTNKDNSE